MYIGFVAPFLTVVLVNLPEFTLFTAPSSSSSPPHHHPHPHHHHHHPHQQSLDCVIDWWSRFLAVHWNLDKKFSDFLSGIQCRFELLQNKPTLVGGLCWYCTATFLFGFPIFLHNFTNLNYFKLNEQLFGCQLYRWLSS